MLLYLWNTHYAMRGGCSSDGSLCGVFFVFTAAGVGYTNWARGAALSFKLLMIIYHSNNITYFIEGIFLWIELLLV